MIRGMGTAANVLAVLIGSGLGILLKRGIAPRFQDMMMKSMGVCIIFIGISGAMTGMLRLGADGALTSGSSLALIASMLFGSLLGELLNLEGLLERFGVWLRTRTRGQNDSRFVEGFLNASLTICVGAMAIVGSIEDGLNGNATLLYTKAVLDFVIVLVFASSYGRGVAFSALPLLILQGGVTLAAALVAPLMRDSVVSALSFSGSVLIFCVGVNLCFGKKFKVANMLPSLILIGVLAGLGL